MKQRKWHLTLTSFLFLVVLFLPSQAYADASKTPEDVLEDFNVSVKLAYEGIYQSPVEECFIDPKLYEQLDARNKYLASQQSQFNIVSLQNDWNIVEFQSFGDDKLKLMIQRNIEQKLNRSGHGEIVFEANSKEGYLLQKLDGKWKIVEVVDGTFGENPRLKSFENNMSINDIEIAKNEEIIENLAGIDYLNAESNITTDEMLSFSVVDSPILMRYAYAKINAANYALDWGGSNRNPNYSDYSYSGGDCANFTSQCLEAGGLPRSSSWYPDSYQWINVNGQRDSLINTGRAKGFYQAFPQYPSGKDLVGTVLHYTNGNQWYHAVIITTDFGNNNVRVTGHTNDVINGPVMPLANIRSFQVL